MKTKNGLKDKATDALDQMKVEGGAKGLSKSDADAEIKDLKQQIKDDEKHITDTEKALDDKKTEYKDRRKIRTGVLEAISKAIAILHGDDARDTFKRSLKSQGYSLAQLSEGAMVSSAVGLHRVVDERVAAVAALRRSRDERIRQIADRIAAATSGHFDKVISAIDKLITKLDDEETADKKNKDDCEKDRKKDTQDSIDLSREIDELTDKITKLEEEIKEHEEDMEEGRR